MEETIQTIKQTYYEIAEKCGFKNPPKLIIEPLDKGQLGRYSWITIGDGFKKRTIDEAIHADPIGMDDLDDDQITAILAHEFAHWLCHWQCITGGDATADGQNHGARFLATWLWIWKTVTSQDGLPAGNVTDVYISPNDGIISLMYSNGMSEQVGQVALARFSNPTGLIKGDDTSFLAGLNSGVPQIGAASTGGRGAIAASYLEASNVDMAQEFTNMILAQRGFQASSRVITTSRRTRQHLPQHRSRRRLLQ